MQVGSVTMIAGDLDLDWAEQDPEYLAQIKGFLLSNWSAPAGQPHTDDAASEISLRWTSRGANNRFKTKILPEQIDGFGGDATK